MSGGVKPEVEMIRYARFERLREYIEAYECGECLGHDRTRRGGTPDGRWAIHAQGDEGRSELTRVSDRKDRAQMVCEGQIAEGWTIRAIYDLDELAGDEPGIEIDDTVIVDGDESVHYVVTDIMATTNNGFDAECFELDHVDTDGESLSEVLDTRVTVVEKAEGDTRIPKRYDVALIKVVVAFNTVAS